MQGGGSEERGWVRTQSSGAPAPVVLVLATFPASLGVAGALFEPRLRRTSRRTTLSGSSSSPAPTGPLLPARATRCCRQQQCRVGARG